MARFVFRLEAVRTVRQRAFEDKQRVVAARRRAIAAEQERIAALQAEIHGENDAARQEQAGGRLDIPAVCRARLRVAFLRRQIAEREVRVLAHERELVRERAEMLAANVAVKALDKLEERGRRRFTEEQERRATAEQGEIALQLHRRQVLAEQVTQG